MKYLYIVISLICANLFSYRPIKLYQLSYYRVSEFITALKSKIKGVVVFVLTPLFFQVFASVFPSLLLYIIITQLILSLSVFFYIKKTEKTKVNFTQRLKSFLLVNNAFLIVAIVGLWRLNLLPLTPLALILCATISHPIVSSVYKRVNQNYLKKAQEKLGKINPVIIAVVGSYGKTTLKNALANILGQKYRVKCTSLNYNTPLGIARSITENLSSDTEIFIVEMGARRVGDIAEICSYFPPHYAVITSVGTQHLATFKSRENILLAKGEVLDSKTLKTVFINGEDENAKKLIERVKCKLIVSSKNDYENIQTSEYGLTFTIKIGSESFVAQTSLIGRYAPPSINLCSRVAQELGLTAKQIIKGIKLVKSVAHRLELLYNGLDIIIDDSYNANEQGVEVALETLKSFNRTRIVVTPGIVELGREQAKANYKIGSLCAKCSDYAVFLGVNKAFLESGAIDNGMERDRVILVKNLAEASEKLKKIKGERAILFSNDLPENY